MGCHCFRDKESPQLPPDSDHLKTTAPGPTALTQGFTPSTQPSPEEVKNQTGTSLRNKGTAAPRKSQLVPGSGVKLRELRVTTGGLASCYAVEKEQFAGLVKAQVKESKKQCWVQTCAFKADRRNKDKSQQFARTLRSLDHPNVLKVLDVLQDQDHCYVVYEATESQCAEELSEHVETISEQWAANILRQVFAALSHCHSQGLVLGTLSLRHVLFTAVPTEQCTWVKLLLPQEEEAQYRTGYMAPEFKNKTYFGPANDLWSCGVMISALLAGEFMLREKPKAAVPQELKAAYLKWQGVSKEAKSLTLSLLSRNYQSRPSLEACLQHPWLAVSAPTPSLTPSIRTALRHLSSLKPVSSLKQALLRLMVNLVVPYADLQAALEAFRELDTDLDGAVSEEELQAHIVRLFPEQQAQSALTAITSAGVFSQDRKLMYSQFLLWASSHQVLCTPSNTASLFRLLDKSHDKKVTAGEVNPVLCLEQEDTKEGSAWSVLMQEMGKAREETVTLAEFCSFLQRA